MKPHQHEMEATKMGFRMIGITPREPDAEFYVGRSLYDGPQAQIAQGGPPPRFAGAPRP